MIAAPTKDPSNRPVTRLMVWLLLKPVALKARLAAFENALAPALHLALGFGVLHVPAIRLVPAVALFSVTVLVTRIVMRHVQVRFENLRVNDAV